MIWLQVTPKKVLRCSTLSLWETLTLARESFKNIYLCKSFLHLQTCHEIPFKYQRGQIYYIYMYTHTLISFLFYILFHTKSGQWWAVFRYCQILFQHWHSLSAARNHHSLPCQLSINSVRLYPSTFSEVSSVVRTQAEHRSSVLNHHSQLLLLVCFSSLYQIIFV